MTAENEVLNKMLASAAGRKQLQKMIVAHVDDKIYLERNKERFLKEYGDCWIVILNLNEIAHGTFQTVADHLKTLKVDFGDAFLQFIANDEELEPI